MIYAFNTHADKDPLVQNWAVVGRPEHQGRFQGSAILLARMAAWINLMMKDSVSASSDFGELSAFVLCVICTFTVQPKFSIIIYGTLRVPSVQDCGYTHH